MRDFNSSYFLPHHYKKIGWGMIIGHIILIIISGLLDFLGLGIFQTFQYILVPLLPYSVMISLTIVISSREKNEDEMIRLIRLKSFQYGLYLTILVFVVAGIVRLLDFSSWRMWMGGGGINATLIYIVVIYHFKLHNLSRDEE